MTQFAKEILGDLAFFILLGAIAIIALSAGPVVEHALQRQHSHWSQKFEPLNSEVSQ